MSEDLFATWSRVPVRAVLVATHLDLRPLQQGAHLALSPLTITVGERGAAVLFRDGAVVLFNVRAIEEADFLKCLNHVVDQRLEILDDEETEIALDPGGDERVDAGGSIRLRQFTIDRLQTVADVLAKSVILAYDEHRVANVFERTEPVAEALRRPDERAIPVRQLLGHIGDVLITQHRMVGRVEVTEKPEWLWDRPDLERLYVRLQEEYDLRERDRALSRKLNLISQTAETALGLVQARRSLRVEWYIVILIVIEIFLTIYQMFITP